MLKLLLENRDEEIDASTFEPEKERVRTIAPCSTLQVVLMAPWRSSTRWMKQMYWARRHLLRQYWHENEYPIPQVGRTQI